MPFHGTLDHLVHFAMIGFERLDLAVVTGPSMHLVGVLGASQQTGTEGIAGVSRQGRDRALWLAGAKIYAPTAPPNPASQVSACR